MARIQFFDGAVPAAGTTTYDVSGQSEGDVVELLLQAKLAYGSGGTTIDCYVQTSVDGAVWVDIAEFSFATANATKLSKVISSATMAANYTPTDGTLTANTVKDGLIGDALRLKLVVVGTYAGSTLAVYGSAKNS